MVLDGEVHDAQPRLNTGVPVDPGDHEVKIESPGKAQRTLTVHIDPAVLSRDLGRHRRTEVTAVAVAVVAPAPPAALLVEPPIGSSQGDPGGTRRWIGFSLFIPGAAGVAIGTWLVTSRVQAYMPDGQPCDTHLRNGAVPGAIVAYAAGGLAIATGITLIVTAPKHREVALGPMAVPGGGGAELSTTF